MPSARSTRQVGWPRPCKGFSKTASPRRRRCVRVLAALLTCMRRDRRRHARGCGGLQRPFFFLSCSSAICARCIVIARTAACRIACLPRSAFSTSTCLVDGRARRAPETRSGRCLFLALSIRSYRESINAGYGMRIHRTLCHLDKDFRKLHARDADSACCTDCSTWRLIASFALASIRFETYVPGTSALEHLRALARISRRPRNASQRSRAHPWRTE